MVHAVAALAALALLGEVRAEPGQGDSGHGRADAARGHGDEPVAGVAPRQRGLLLAALLLLLGAAVFAGALAGLAFGGPRLLGAVAPVGGVTMMAGWLVLARALAAPSGAGRDG